MCGVLQRMKDGLSLFGRDVELTRAVLSNVDADDPCDLFAVWLGGNCILVSASKAQGYQSTYMASTSCQRPQKRALLRCDSH